MLATDTLQTSWHWLTAIVGICCHLYKLTLFLQDLTWCRLIRMLVIRHTAFTTALSALCSCIYSLKWLCMCFGTPTLITTWLSKSDRCNFSAPVMLESWYGVGQGLPSLWAPQFASPPLEIPKSKRVNVFLELCFSVIAITLVGVALVLTYRDLWLRNHLQLLNWVSLAPATKLAFTCSNNHQVFLGDL